MHSIWQTAYVIRSRVVSVIQWTVIVTLRHPYKMTAMFLRSDHIICMQYYLLCVELDNNRWNSQPFALSPFPCSVYCNNCVQQMHSPTFYVRFEGDIVIHKVVRLTSSLLLWMDHISSNLDIKAEHLHFVQWISNGNLCDTHFTEITVVLHIEHRFFLFFGSISLESKKYAKKRDFPN